MIERFIPIRKLSQQSRMLARAGVIAGLVIIAAIQWMKQPPPKAAVSAIEDKNAVSARGTFRPTPEQWKSFTFATARRTRFQPELVTDGFISNNEGTTTPVFSPYSGRVSKLMAQLGDFVTQGTPLMTVETSDFIQARNNLIMALAALNTAQHHLKAAQPSATPDELIAKQRALNIAQSVVTAAANQIRLLGNSDAEIEAIEHDPARQRINPGAYVLAPISGTVTQRQVGVGQYVTTPSSGASTPVYTIDNLSTVWLVGNVREADASQVRLGEAVEVTVPAYPGKVFKAKITWIATSVDPNTHRLQVRAEVLNPDGLLKPMMFASFRIQIGRQTESLAIPQSAVVYEGSVAHVWVANNDGSLVSRQVSVGRTNDDGLVEISSGLNAGETIVTSGTLFIDRAAENNNS